MEIKEANLAEVWELRREVMYPDESISFARLDNDDKGMHLGLYEKKQLISVISLFIKNGELQFRKFEDTLNTEYRGLWNPDTAILPKSVDESMGPTGPGTPQPMCTSLPQVYSFGPVFPK